MKALDTGFCFSPYETTATFPSWWDKGKYDHRDSGMYYHKNKAFYNISSSCATQKILFSQDITRIPLSQATGGDVEPSPLVTVPLFVYPLIS